MFQPPPALSTDFEFRMLFSGDVTSWCFLIEWTVGWYSKTKCSYSFKCQNSNVNKGFDVGSIVFNGIVFEFRNCHWRTLMHWSEGKSCFLQNLGVGMCVMLSSNRGTMALLGLVDTVWHRLAALQSLGQRFFDKCLTDKWIYRNLL